MEYAYATYQILTPTRAIVTVDYPNGFGMERVEVKHGHSLYEACYSAAEVKASLQGLRLERFSIYVDK